MQGPAFHQSLTRERTNITTFLENIGNGRLDAGITLAIIDSTTSNG
jgi:hypothetical protein